MGSPHDSVYPSLSGDLEGADKHTHDTWSQDEGPQKIARSKSPLQKFVDIGLLPALFAIAMVCGVAIGFIVRKVDPSFSGDNRRLMYLGFPGELMISMLKEVILPLILTSLIAGVGALPSKSSGKLGWRMILYYMATTFTAVVIGIVFVVIIKPGDRGDIDVYAKKIEEGPNGVDSLLDLIRNIFPSNLITACFAQIKTVVDIKANYTIHFHGNDTSENFSTTGIRLNEIKKDFDDSKPETNYTITDLVFYDEELSTTTGGSTNTLGIILFAVMFGLMISRLGDRGHRLIEIFSLMQEVMINIVKVVIWFCPIGIVFLLAQKIVAMKDPARDFTQLAYYMATVIAGLITHFFVVLPLIYFAFTRKNPFKLMMDMSPALLLAVSTASSAATMPVTLKSLKERARVNPLVSNFMIPVGATINMDGTALYEAVACIFIAQYENIPLSVGQHIIVAITATAAAIGAAGVPEAGLVTMLIVLEAVGLPTKAVGMIYAIDWFLDRLRTTLNVWGDSVGAATVAHRLRDELGDDGEDPPEYNTLELPETCVIANEYAASTNL